MRDKQLAPTQRLLDIEKSRTGCSGLFQLQLDVDDYSWQHQGEFDPSQAGQDSSSLTASLPLKARLLNFLEERPGVPFEVEELVGEFGSNRETIRKTLDRLWRSGLVQFEERIKPNNNGKNGQTRYKVYLAPDLSQRLEPSQGQGLVAGTTLDVSLGQPPCPNDKLPVVPTTKPAPNQDSVSLGQNGSRTPPSEKISFYVGVRVVIVMPGSRYEGQTGMVRRVFTEHSLTLFTVQLDGTQARVDYRAEYLKPAV